MGRNKDAGAIGRFIAATYRGFDAEVDVERLIQPDARLADDGAHNQLGAGLGLGSQAHTLIFNGEELYLPQLALIPRRGVRISG